MANGVCEGDGDPRLALWFDIKGATAMHDHVWASVNVLLRRRPSCTTTRAVA